VRLTISKWFRFKIRVISSFLSNIILSFDSPDVDESSQGKSSKTAQYVKKGFQNDDGNNEDNLIPPLEKCIRTKWNDAHVCWNGSEPIL
jgi:hypothetical protein